MGILALIGAMALGGLNTILEQDEIARDQMARLTDIQRTVRWMTEDIAAIQPRFVRDELGTAGELPLLADGRGDYLLRLSRGGWRNPARLPHRGTLQRVQYRLEDDQLYREYWPVMDRVLGLEARSTRVLDGVRRISLSYLDDSDEWQTVWPPLRDAGTAPFERPRAIRIVMELDDWGEIERLVEVAR